jgi:hypothetical protein
MNNTLNDDRSVTNSVQNLADTSTIATNLLKDYASYSPVISLLVTNIEKYNTMVKSQIFVETDWEIICKSGGVGAKKATGFNASSTYYFSRDLYIDSVEINTLVGMSQENRGSNATDIEFTIIEPMGMDLIEQLFDYCNNALNESNYCQLPYLLKIEFKGFKDDGTHEIVPYASKYIPIHLINMDLKVNNMGAIYKVSAVAFNELSVTEQYGRISSSLQLGTELAVATITGLDSKTQQDVSNGVISSSVANAVANAAAVATSSGTVGIAPIGNGGVLHEITESFAAVLNSFQQTLLHDGTIRVPDTYSITYTDFPDKNGSINIGQYLFLDSATLSNTYNPPVGKDSPMGKPLVTENNQINVIASAQNLLKYSLDTASGVSNSGAVTYNNAHLITFNSGSSIIDCLNTLIINSNYIVSQINHYNELINDINSTAGSLNLKTGTGLPSSLQEKLNQLNNTPLNWFKIIPIVTVGAYDSAATRNVYARNINYQIQPYKIYNARSISSPNGNPATDNRIIKEYDYIFTGKNTEILTFDLSFNNAFLTYAQFNHDTKIQGTGAGMPANNNQISALSNLQTISSPINNGQSKKLVSSSNKDANGIGAITPERNQAADIASTIYAISEQIQLDLNIIGDPDYIRQDGIFINPSTSNVFLYPTSQYNNRGILFNNGEVYATVNFKIPQDINVDTGILELSYKGDAINYKRNVFSGQYRIITVSNKFDHGSFTQHLNLIRYDDSHNYTINTQKS